MAVDKGLVLTAINKKFEGKSLSKTFKENVATKWAVKIDNDTDIDAYVDDREDVVLEASTEADRRATEAVKKITPPKVEKKEGEAEVEIDETQGMTTFEKMMLQKFGALESKITGFETQQTQKTLTESFKSHPELQGIPELFFKGRIPNTVDEMETAVAELKADYTAYATENKLASFGKDIPNNFGGDGKPTGEVKPATPEEIAKLFPNI